MTKVSISYHQENLDLGKCDIELPNEMVEELLEKFRRLFSKELKEAIYIHEGPNTHISFLASRKKIEMLETVIVLAKDMTVRLN